ncbi:MAG: ATP-binding cassette domain-containing protein [Butyrivibrio sp.]|nr:ATP-binding cassette domain-containing protein [Butyrivibrio sp.]
MDNSVLLSASHLKKKYRIDRKNSIFAVNDVSLDIFTGETLALVGESGCGKSTLSKILMQIIKPDEGTVSFEGKEISSLSERALRPYISRMQMVFQDPASSLDPRMKIRDIIAEPLKAFKIYGTQAEMNERILELTDMVELKEDCLNRYPHEFSGGQKQRIGIARAIAASPKLLVCDESVSALDVCVQAQILNLLKRLKNQLGLTCLFISHDLSVVSFIADRVCVMKNGAICELAPAEKIYSAPEHEYTKYLLASVYCP